MTLREVLEQFNQPVSTSVKTLANSHFCVAHLSPHCIRFLCKDNDHRHNPLKEHNNYTCTKICEKCWTHALNQSVYANLKEVTFEMYYILTRKAGVK